MSSRLPVELNPFRLVEQRKSLCGTLLLTRLQRLRELLSNSDDHGDDKVEVSLDFNKTETGLPCISGQIKAELHLSCQRCLDTLAHSVQADVKVILVTSDAQSERLQEGYDTYLVEDDRLFLEDFIEDEILLTLPLSVMHEDCEPVRNYIEALPTDGINDHTSDQQNQVEEDVKENPFATLNKLKL